MKINFKPFFLIAAIAVSFSSCYYDSLEELHPAPIIIPGINDSTSTGCDTVNAITYTADIKPILDGNCGTGNNCHNGSGSQSGIDLSNYDGAKAIAGALVDAVTWGDGISNMPKGSTSKINDCSIAKIRKWVNSGTAE
jgi:hypothetical protein